MLPKISVIIPLYNKEKFIKTTICSVLEQDFYSFEVIVVNDGSTDNSLKEVKSVNDDRLVVVDKTNGGVSSARNAGIRRARGEWIFFLDADDTISKDCLTTLYNLHQKYNDVEICCGNFVMQYPDVKNDVYCCGKDECVIQDNFRSFYDQKFFICVGLFIVHRNVFQRTGLFDESLSTFEDLELFFKFLKVCRIAYTPKVVFIYEKQASELSRTVSSKTSMYKIDLSNASGYEKKVYTKILIDEMVTARRNKKVILELLKEQRKHLLYVLIHFIPCFLKSLKNAHFLQRKVKSLLSRKS